MEMNAVVAERKISAALSMNVSAAVDQVYSHGDDVSIYREKERNG